MWTRLGPVIASAASLTVLVACADGAQESAEDGDPSPDSPGTEAPDPTSSPAPGATGEAEAPEIDIPTEDAEIVEDMIHESSAGWEDYDVASETLLRFVATSGNQACYGQRYQVEETAEEVAVAIIVGNRPDGAEICTQEAIFIAVPVELEDPLGDRDVVELEDPELAAE